MSYKKVKNMERDQQKAVFYRLTHPLPVTKKNVKNKMKKRSKHAKSMDRSITAKTTYDIRSQKGRQKWMKQPERTDIRSIDTALGKQQYKAKVRKKEIKVKKRQIRKLHKKIQKKKQIIQRKKASLETKEGIKEVEKRWEKRAEKKEKLGEITEKELKEIQQIQKEIQENNKKFLEMEEQKKREQEELKKLEEKQVQSKAIIRETKEGKGYYAMSQNTIDQINRLSSKEEKDLVHDVEGWITQRKKGDTSEARETLESIRKDYKIDSPVDAYFGITGVNPYRYIHDRPPKKEKSYPSPAGLELENMMRLSKIKNSLNTIETKHNKLLESENAVKNYKKWIKTEKDEKQKKEYEDKLEKTELEYLNSKKNYDKYIDSQKKVIKTLKEDPNITISTKKSSMENCHDVTLEYKGNYVTAKKEVPYINKAVLKEVEIHYLK